MKNIIFILAIFVFAGCASEPRSYDTFTSRDSEFVESNVTITEKGLTQEQIRGILSTKFPPERTVSVAVIFLFSYYSRSYNNKGLDYYIMNHGKSIYNVEKFVPIPRMFIPRNLTFDRIQELGIRSLCEYTLVFYNRSNRTMTFKQWINGETTFESEIEFLLIDNQTTAIIASDRMYSSVIGKQTFNKDAPMVIEESEDILYTSQAEILADKMNKLFSGNR